MLTKKGAEILNYWTKTRCSNPRDALNSGFVGEEDKILLERLRMEVSYECLRTVTIFAASMSDMLQLVGEIHNTQAMILLVSRTLESSIQTTS